jgi:hypothetical protein
MRSERRGGERKTGDDGGVTKRPERPEHALGLCSAPVTSVTPLLRHSWPHRTLLFALRPCVVQSVCNAWMTLTFQPTATKIH